MGDDEDRAVERAQEPLEPGEPVRVEVVGRLVEQQDVRVAEQRGGEEGARLLAAGEAVERPVGGEVLDPEPAPDLLGTRLGRPGAGDLCALERVRVSVEVAGVLEGGERLPRLAQGVVEERVDAAAGRLLREVADGRGARDRAAVGPLTAGEDAEEGGLAGAVGADEARLGRRG